MKGLYKTYMRIPKKQCLAQNTKGLPLSKRFTKEQINEAVENAHGLTAAICALLDCTTKQWSHWIARHPDTRELCDKCRDLMVDEAEEVMQKALHSPDEKLRIQAAEFILKRLGAKRGWSDQPLIQQVIQVSEQEKIVQQIFGISEN